MKNIGLKKTVLQIVLLSLLLSSSTNAQNRRWRIMKAQKLVAFDLNCARKESFPNQALSKIVQQAISPEDRDMPIVSGDQAFAITLWKHGKTVYFVPMFCGATGNCTWRLYTINPVEYLGEIIGQLIYTYQSSQGMPTIITYGNSSAFEGGLSTYIANKGKYKSLGGEYRVNPHRPIPTFLKAAKPQCKDYGL